MVYKEDLDKALKELEDRLKTGNSLSKSMDTFMSTTSASVCKAQENAKAENFFRTSYLADLYKNEFIFK